MVVGEELALRRLMVGNRVTPVKNAKAVLRPIAAAMALVRPIAAAIFLTRSIAAHAQAYGGDPSGSGPIVGALRWIQGTLLGTVATVVAVIAVASIGFMMLTGRMNWRYGATVILGCFILFGAASIVAGIQSSASVGY